MADAPRTPEPFYDAIGRLTVTWAMIEFGLDGIITVIHHEIGGKTIEPEMPWSLDRKLKYIRKCFRRLSPLQPYQNTVCDLMDSLKLASDLRHDVIHGVIQEVPGENPVQMLRLLRGKSILSIKAFHLSATSILTVNDDAMALCGKTVGLARSLVDRFAV